MKHKPVLSLYRCVYVLSYFCLIIPLAAGIMREGISVFPEKLTVGLLACETVLLMLPVVDEYVKVSLWFAAAASAVCAGGVLAGMEANGWLPGMLLVQGLYLVRRSRDHHMHLQPLFKNMTVWYNVECQSRYVYTLALYLLVAAMPGPAAPSWTVWVQLPFVLALWTVLQLRVHTGRTLFLRPARELELKNLIRGNLRTAPVQADNKTEEMARMSRLYERVISLMEQKHPFLDEDFSLDDLVAAVFTNRGYLSRTINVLSGRNFNQFVNYYRIRYAVDLLRKDPNLRLINVAQMSGFHSSPSFNAAFKVNMGETPSAFQERLRSEKLAK